MRGDVARDLSDSAFEFQRAVWPQIKKWMGGGELHPVEEVAHQGFNKQLDALAGIDAWHIKHNYGIRGIASRVQWMDTTNPRHKRFDTFSIRTKRPSGAETEFAKRMRIISDPDGGFLLPEFTVQAYMSEPKRAGELLSVSAVRTRSLYLYADLLMSGFIDDADYGKDWGRNTAGNGGQEFVWISWDHLAQALDARKSIRIYRKEDEIEILPDPVWVAQYENASIEPKHERGAFNNGQPLVSHVHRLS